MEPHKEIISTNKSAEKIKRGNWFSITMLGTVALRSRLQEGSCGGGSPTAARGLHPGAAGVGSGAHTECLHAQLPSEARLSVLKGRWCGTGPLSLSESLAASRGSSLPDLQNLTAKSDL